MGHRPDLSDVCSGTPEDPSGCTETEKKVIRAVHASERPLRCL